MRGREERKPKGPQTSDLHRLVLREREACACMIAEAPRPAAL